MLEPILKGLVEWLYELMLDIMSYASGELIGVMSMDLSYFERTAPVISDIVNVFIALGWALLIGNLVFQSLKIMMSGAGFEAEDPKILFLRTFVFAFLLLASRQICEMCSAMTGTVIGLLDLPASITVTTPDESMFSLGSGAKWLLVIIVGVVLMVQMVKLLFEIGERYVITSVLTFFAPLAFAMGGSKNTNDIFKGWCRMYGSMLVMMIMNIVFLKLIMSAMSRMASGGVLVWLVFVVALTRVARKIDSHIGKIGLNPAQTGSGIGSRIPGAMTMMAVRVMTSTISRSMAGAKGSAGRNGSSGSSRRSSGPGGSHYRNGSSGTSNTSNTYNSGSSGGNTLGSRTAYTGGSTNANSTGGINVNNVGSNVNRQNIGGNTEGAGRNQGNTNTPKPGTMNTPKQGGTNAPKSTGGANVQRSTLNMQRNNTQRPPVMQKLQGANNGGVHINSQNNNGDLAYSQSSGQAAKYSLNTGRYKVTGRNGESVRQLMSNQSAARPPVPRATAGNNPAGRNVMSSVVRNSQNNTTSGTVKAGDTNSETHNSGTVNKQGQSVSAPAVRTGGVNTNVSGSVKNIGGNTENQNSMTVNGNSSISGGARSQQTNMKADIGGNSGRTQFSGIMNMSKNNSNTDRSHAEYGGDMKGVNIAGNTAIHSEHLDSTRMLENDTSKETHSSGFIQQQSRSDITERRINHEYRHGKYNPAAVNRKVKKSYYRKDNLQERLVQRPSRQRRGDDDDRKHKR